MIETPQSIFVSSRSRKCSGAVRAKCTRLGWQRIITLELGATSLRTSPSHSRCACALSESQVISIRESFGTISGREKSVCGSSGTTPKASTLGAISEPPADKKVGRRTGRRRDADSVGRDVRRRAVVEAKSERHDARDLALAHDDVVESEEAPVVIFGLQRRTLVHEEPALDQRGQIVEPRIVFVEFGQETQAGRC